ncbi:MAG: hypothetical protein ACRELA_07385 [Candidatus Rokuibacteriota bacterium]
MPTGASAVGYIWASPSVGVSPEAQAERIRRYCLTQGWTISTELHARRFPELTELTHRLIQDDARRIVMVREALTDLERRFPDAWRGTRARIEAEGATILAI